MPVYVLPTFNLQCNLWRQLGTAGVYLTPDLSPTCNLTPGRRVLFQGFTVGINECPFGMQLLLPALTDIRARWNNVDGDLVEVPVGSHRFYSVLGVDDLGKGFANEHRLALITYLTLGAQNLVPPILAPTTLP